MLNVQTAQSIISLITFLIAYVVSCTVAGCFAAWIALKMGDDTPEQNGFLTFNPLMHVDFLGLLFMLLYRFGWGRFTPINPFNIHQPWRIAKTIFAFCAETLAFIVISISSMMFLFLLFGREMHILLENFNTGSSYFTAIGLILVSLLTVSAMLSVASFLVNIIGLAVMIYMENHTEYMHYTELIMMAVPLLIFWLFGSSMIGFVLNFIHAIAYLLVSFLPYP